MAIEVTHFKNEQGKVREFKNDSPYSYAHIFSGDEDNVVNILEIINPSQKDFVEMIVKDEDSNVFQLKVPKSMVIFQSKMFEKHEEDVKDYSNQAVNKLK